MATNNLRVAAYLPKDLYDLFSQYAKDKELSESKAVISILAAHLNPCKGPSNNAGDKYVTISQFSELQEKVAHLSALLSDTLGSPGSEKVCADLSVPPPHLGIASWEEFESPGEDLDFYGYLLTRAAKLPEAPPFPCELIQIQVRKKKGALWADYQAAINETTPETRQRLVAADAENRKQWEAERSRRCDKDKAQAQAPDIFAQERSQLNKRNPGGRGAEPDPNDSDPFARERLGIANAIADAMRGDETELVAMLSNYLRMLHTTLPLVGQCLGLDMAGMMPSAVPRAQKIQALKFVFEQWTKPPKDRDSKLAPNRRKEAIADE